MNFINEYKYIVIPVSIWILIQLFKFFSDMIKTKKFDFSRLIGAGGMPSAHSAVVTSLAALIGKNEGINSPLFGIAVCFACIVMYDATGVRRAAGEQAKVLNKIVQTAEIAHFKNEKKLVEVLGHTPLQVLIGAAIGIFWGVFLG